MSNTYLCAAKAFRYTPQGWEMILSDDHDYSQGPSAYAVTRQDAEKFAQENGGEGVRIVVYEGEELVAESALHGVDLFWTADLW